jgi:hypothetical protein
MQLKQDARAVRDRQYQQARREQGGIKAKRVSALEREVRTLFDDVTRISEFTVKVKVQDVKKISWAAVDRAMRAALSTLTNPGVMLVAQDSKRTVIFEALVLSSRREDVTRMTGPLKQVDLPEQAARHIGPEQELVKVRADDEPFCGVRRMRNRWVAVASCFMTKGTRMSRHVVSIGTAETAEEAARIRDLYVLGLWHDKQLRHPPTLNYPLSRYQELLEPEWKLTT